MALACVELGHEWTVLTDHSPRLTVARGLTRERLERQLDVVAAINSELAPFRYLTGIEVDINEDGSLDQDDDLLARLDLVVASVHSKLRAPSEAMTRRMVRAIANPHVDVLGHCTGRLVGGGKSRPESEFEVDIVIEACRQFGVALEINSRPERLDPPRRDPARSRGGGPAARDRHRRPRARSARLAGQRRRAGCRVRRRADSGDHYVAGGRAPGVDGRTRSVGEGTHDFGCRSSNRTLTASSTQCYFVLVVSVNE